MYLTNVHLYKLPLKLYQIVILFNMNRKKIKRKRKYKHFHGIIKLLVPTFPLTTKVNYHTPRGTKTLRFVF